MLPGPGLSSAEISLFIFVPNIYFFYTAARVPRFRFWQFCLPGAAVQQGDFQLQPLFQTKSFSVSSPPTVLGGGADLFLSVLGGEEKSTSDHGLRLLWIPCCAPGCINRQVFFFSPKAKYQMHTQWYRLRKARPMRGERHYPCQH